VKRGHMVLLGATGIFGKQLTQALEAKGFPSKALTLVASKHSEGEELSYGEESLCIEAMAPAALKGATLAVLALPRKPAAQAMLWAEQAGLRILDASGGSLPKIPLLSPHAHAEGAKLEWPPAEQHLALASPLAHALACLLFPLRPLGRVEATAICGAACLGKGGVQTLEQQTLAMLNGREAEAEGGRRQAFNILPAFEGEEGGFANHAEAEAAAELSRLLGSPVELGLHVFLAPFFFGISLSFSVVVGGGKGLEHWRKALALGHGIKMLDGNVSEYTEQEDTVQENTVQENKAHSLFPMPMLVSQDASLLVGKLRLQGNVLRGVLAFEPANRLAEFAATLAMAGVDA